MMSFIFFINDFPNYTLHYNKGHIDTSIYMPLDYNLITTISLARQGKLAKGSQTSFPLARFSPA